MALRSIVILQLTAELIQSFSYLENFVSWFLAGDIPHLNHIILIMYNSGLLSITINLCLTLNHLRLQILYNAFFDSGIRYSGCRIARSAPSAFIVNGGENNWEKWGSSQVYEGPFAKRPPLPRYSKTWDLNIVLKFLGKAVAPEKIDSGCNIARSALSASIVNGERTIEKNEEVVRFIKGLLQKDPHFLVFPRPGRWKNWIFQLTMRTKPPFIKSQFYDEKGHLRSFWYESSC